MDTSPIAGVQGHGAITLLQPSASDFADELRKEQPQQTTDFSRRGTGHEKATEQGEAVADEASRNSTELVASEERGSFVSAMAGSELTMSTIATAGQVLSARVFGLHLQASGYLSEYQLAAEMIESAGHRTETIGEPADEVRTYPSSVEHPITSEVPGSKLGDVLASADLTPWVLTMNVTHALPDHFESSALPISATDAWTETLWQKRALRLFARSDGGHVAWLRDYTLSKDEAYQLAASLAHQFEGQGVHLRGIMWNGHEVWSSMDIDQGDSHVR